MKLINHLLIGTSFPKKLFLDDYRVPKDCASYMYQRGQNVLIYHEDWEIVRSYKQFCDWITKNGLPDIISFDHDLADVHELKESLVIDEWFDLTENREYTGMDCAKWLVNYCLDNKLELPNFIVHSANPAGCDNINGLLKNFKEKGSYTSTYWTEEPDENN